MVVVIEPFKQTEFAMIPIRDELILATTTITISVAEMALSDSSNSYLGEEGSFGSTGASVSIGDDTEEVRTVLKLTDE